MQEVGVRQGKAEVQSGVAGEVVTEILRGR